MSSRQSTPVDELIDEAVKGLDGFSSSNTASASLDFSDRVFSIDSVGRRCEQDGHELFEVHWSQTEVPRRLITRNKDKVAVVQCDGEECEVHTQTRLRKGRDDIRLVEWKPSWLSREEMRRFGHEPETGDQERSVRESPRKRRKRATVQNDTPKQSTAEQPGSPATESPLLKFAKVKGLRFQPKAGVVYTDEIRKVLSECAFGSAEKLLEEPTRNDIVFRDRFVEKGSFFNALERKNRSGAMLQMAGFEQRQACEYCSRGNGPFDKCILLRKYFKSACANCVYGGTGKNCNYHLETHLADGPWTPRKAAKSSVAVEVTAARAVTSSPSPGRKTNTGTRQSQGDKSAEAKDLVNQGPNPEYRKTRKGDVACTAKQQFNEDDSPATQGLAEEDTPSPGKRKKRKRSVADVLIDRPGDEQAERLQASPSQQAPDLTERSQRRPQGASTSSFPTPLDWRTNYLTPDFRHDGCPPIPSPCQSLTAGCSSPESDLQPVERGRIFARGEATPEEVRWLIRRAGCSTTELLRRAWLERLMRRKDLPLPESCTKESYLSQWYPGKLTRAAALYGIERDERTSPSWGVSRHRV